MRKALYWFAAIMVAATGLALSGSLSGGNDENGEPKQNPKEVLAKLKLTPDSTSRSGLDAFRGNLAATFAKPKRELKTQNVEAKAVERMTPNGEAFAPGLQFTCDPRVINTFVVGGQPLNAKRFTYSVDTISWQAGQGWPVYTVYCPVDRYDNSMYFPDAKMHQIVPIIQGQNYFVGCNSSGVCAAVSGNSGQIAFAVNDNQYDDNLGYFTVTIYGVEN